jgi:hypothetical protein
MARLSLLPKVALWLVALSVLAVLFLRSAQSTREAPFTVEREGLASWSLVLEPDKDTLGSWLVLIPPPRLAPPLGRQIFSRAGEYGPLFLISFYAVNFGPVRATPKD